MEYHIGLVRPFLKVGSLLSILTVSIIFYVLIRYRDFYLSEKGIKSLKQQKKMLRVGITLGLVGFLFFISCETLETIERLGRLPNFLVLAHHYLKIPQLGSMLAAQLTFLYLAIDLRRVVENYDS
jgi:hypothetical protein